MNRLVTRLVLAMLAVALLSASVIVLSQLVGAQLHFRRLPADVRADVLEHNERRPPRSAPPGGSVVDGNDKDRPPVLVPGVLPGEREAFVERAEYVRGLADVRDYQRRATLIGVGVAALLATLIAMYLARTISRPIERVAAAAADVAEGDLSVRVPDPTASGSIEVKTLTRNFNAMAASLQTGEQQRRAMIADIAHELRTPLAAMTLRFQALEDDLLPFDKAQVKRLHLQADLLARLVQDLRTLSLADAGQLSLHLRATNLVALLDTVCEGYSDKAAEANVRLEFRPSLASLSALVDPERITQIVSNLLDNALRVTAAGGVVTVSLDHTGDAAILRVKDTGPGLSESALEHLFDRFFQDRDTKGSSGLGLAIVKALSELHGGSVLASNVLDGNHANGAQFQVRLPLSQT